MIGIHILSVGKTKESWLDEGIAEFEKRLTGRVRFTSTFVKDDEQLLREVSRSKGVIALDPFGKEMTSESFSKFLVRQAESQGSRLTFVIGGPDGLPADVRETVPLVSLSKMTFTHQMVRLVLVEQIYRALEIAKGSGYHR